jgi:hypothetical protein
MTTDQDVFSLWKQHSEAIGRFFSVKFRSEEQEKAKRALVRHGGGDYVKWNLLLVNERFKLNFSST